MKRHHLTLGGFLWPLIAAGLVWALLLHGHGGGKSYAACALVFVIGWPLLALLIWSGPSLLVALFTSPRQRASRRKRLKDAGYARSAPIRTWVRRAVFRADRYRCVYCRVKCHRGAGLQADHYRPYAGGGRSDVFNLFALCALHNRIKSDYWVDKWDGYMHYHPYMVQGDPVMAAAILAAERRHRLNPLRWLRAAWALAW